MFFKWNSLVRQIQNYTLLCQPWRADGIHSACISGDRFSAISWIRSPISQYLLGGMFIKWHSIYDSILGYLGAWMITRLLWDLHGTLLRQVRQLFYGHDMSTNISNFEAPASELLEYLNNVSNKITKTFSCCNSYFYCKSVCGDRYFSN